MLCFSQAGLVAGIYFWSLLCLLVVAETGPPLSLHEDQISNPLQARLSRSPSWVQKDRRGEGDPRTLAGYAQR